MVLCARCRGTTKSNWMLLLSISIKVVQNTKERQLDVVLRWTHLFLYFYGYTATTGLTCIACGKMLHMLLVVSFFTMWRCSTDCFGYVLWTAEHIRILHTSGEADMQNSVQLFKKAFLIKEDVQLFPFKNSIDCSCLTTKSIMLMVLVHKICISGFFVHYTKVSVYSYKLPHF